MNRKQALDKMVSPNQKRPNAYRNGIIQIHTTRCCDLKCFGCTQGSNLKGKPYHIPVEEFENACKSLENYWGVIGMFGGNPATHPQFEKLCDIFSLYFPKEQRGIWCNNPLGHGAVMRDTFSPRHSNLNVHQNVEAYKAFRKSWPEAERHIVGLHEDSRHAPPYIALQDVIKNEEERWERIADCDINKYWSAMVAYIPTRGLRGFFCEIAGAQAILHSEDPTWPDTGLKAEPGWWNQNMDAFSGQVDFHCHRCGIPLNRKGQLAVNGEYEEVSETHLDIYTPKDLNRQVKVITDPNEPQVSQVTKYLAKES